MEGREMKRREKEGREKEGREMEGRRWRGGVGGEGKDRGKGGEEGLKRWGVCWWMGRM